MAGPLLRDRVWETSVTTGTGAFTLAGAVVGYQTFAAALSVGDTFPYCIASQGGTEWEVGVGTLSASTTLTRTTVLASSNGGSAVNFSAGAKDCFLTYPAGRAVLKTGSLTNARVLYVSANGELTDSGDLAFSGTALRVSSHSPTLNSATRAAFISSSALTTTALPAVVVGHNSSGTPGAGFGVEFEFWLESSTTEDRQAGQIVVSWNVATDASRASDLTLYARYTTSWLEGIRIRGASGGVQLGFFGVTPASRPSSTAEIKASLVNLGLLTGGGATNLVLNGGTLICGECEIDNALNHDGTTIGFFGATPTTQHSATGETTGFTGGAGTACRVDSTFTGNVGSTAYTLSDVVKALKNYGLLAS